MNAPTLLADRYELLRQLGRGGMAQVHLAHDRRLGRTVAVKTLLSDHAQDTVFQQRFQREAQAVASLNHPSIAAVYDTGEGEINGVVVPYIVMEYVEGATLADLLERGPMMPEEALRICAGVLRALAYSHEHGIVHRDIKPANVMLTTEGQVKVMDFGIARAMGAGGMTMTATATVIGTAHYLSPEQARGEKVDARSDLYSSGCLLYELLTGRPPFDGESAVAVAYQHVTAEPDLPSNRAPGVASGIDDVVMVSLAKGREERYQSADEMRLDIEAVLGYAPVPGTSSTQRVTAVGHPVPAPTQSGGGRRAEQRAARSAGDDRRKRTLLIAAGVALAVISIVAFTSLLGGGDDDTFTLRDYSGSSTSEAAEQLRQDGLTPKTGTARSCGKPEKVVCATDPEAGSQVTDGATITLFPSDGTGEIEGSVEVPDVTGEQEDAAMSALREAGLEPVRETRESSETPAGTVLSQSPEGGEEAEAGSEVTVTVATAPAAGDGGGGGGGEQGGDTGSSAAETVNVPDLNGRSVADARAALAGLGLAVAEVNSEDGAPPGVVIGQEPASGAAVAPGSPVTITVSTGPAQVTTTPVPDVAGSRSMEAMGTLLEAGFMADLDQSCLRPRSTASYSRPAGGVPAEAGSSVTVFCESSHHGGPGGHDDDDDDDD
ncbi:Stk1 family PASTA domain-containing Ser/Thr kinase [Streptomyces spiramenti]|uniref:non-specific serine/threonine protein kinase n=1 Tax=Streptomyces spiramenti TaxID=2720606 RepID=A0ABX1ALQ4_9ACTN|nr:Stk1 family PASTA domain-containing Ser/Thr kinase [Streptomyces spiramenti]NJP66000.1 Stk1 family PASTA domain-containing Ser/Thr kinase [Streptomyces spiramenti]